MAVFSGDDLEAGSGALLPCTQRLGSNGLSADLAWTGFGVMMHADGSGH